MDFFFLLSGKLSFPTRFELLLFEERNCVPFSYRLSPWIQGLPPPPPLKMRKTKLESLQTSWYPVCTVCHDEFFRWGPVVTADVTYESRILTRRVFKTVSSCCVHIRTWMWWAYRCDRCHECGIIFTFCTILWCAAHFCQSAMDYGGRMFLP